MEDKITFKRNIVPMGNSIGNSIPKEVADYLGFQKGDEIIIIVDINKEGQKYMQIYKND